GDQASEARRGAEMSSRKRSVGLALTLAVALGGGFVAVSNPPARGDDTEKAAGDLKLLKGRWTTENESSTWEFDGEKMKSTHNNIDYKCKVAVNPRATPHSTIDFIIIEGSEEAKGLTALGIYKVDGDHLT